MSFFHLFDWDEQVAIGKRIVSLLRPRPGSVLVGRQVGRIRNSEGPASEGALIKYYHNEESWKELWEVVQRETGTRWKVDALGESWGETASPETLRMVREQGQMKLRFLVKRE